MTNEYILVSPHRIKRPWLGQTEPLQSINLPKYDPDCYLCPGNRRSNGEQNPSYNHTFTFENDFAAVLPPPLPSPPPPPHPFLTCQPIHGACDVVVFHPRHDLTLSDLPLHDIESVIDEWTRIYQMRGAEQGIKYVQIFENKGAMMGCSNPHPHAQIWSLSVVPTIAAVELESLIKYSLSHTVAPSDAGSPSVAPVGPRGRPCLLCEYAHVELKLQTRVVVLNQSWVAVVPWWATWPFELIVLPYRRHIPCLSDLDVAEKAALADIIARVSRCFDNLFSCSFPYSMGVHQQPIPAQNSTIVDDQDVAHIHLHFDPPLLRSATVRKFLVGFELMAEAQRDLTPEEAAVRLRSCSEGLPNVT